MESTKGITCKVEETLHQKVTEEREAQDMTMSDFITKVLNFYFNNRGGRSSMGKDGKRTLAFQVDEEFFQRINYVVQRSEQKSKTSYLLAIIEEAVIRDEARLAEEDARQTAEVQEDEQQRSQVDDQEPGSGEGEDADLQANSEEADIEGIELYGYENGGLE